MSVLSRIPVTRPSKMLRYARMAGLVKLRRGIREFGQRRLWAASDVAAPPDSSTFAATPHDR